jgi:hypothetical protein
MLARDADADWDSRLGVLLEPAGRKALSSGTDVELYVVVARPPAMSGIGLVSCFIVVDAC